MKKFILLAACVTLVLSSCGQWSNLAKGSAIGGGSGAAVGAGVGAAHYKIGGDDIILALLHAELFDDLERA